MPAPAHVLIVDGDQTFARTLSRLLAENGYDPATLSSAVGLAEYMATRTVDLLILDLAIPEEDGFTILERLRRDPVSGDLPVLALSPTAVEETSIRALGLGASDVIAKPVRVRELLARVRTHLRAGRELNRARSEARSQAALVDLLREMTSNLPTRELYQILVRQVAAGLRIPRCSILFGAPHQDQLTVAAASDNPILNDLAVDIGRYPEIRKALDTGEVVLVRDAPTDVLYQGMTNIETTSSLVIPFSLQGKRAGVFFLRTGEGDPPLGDTDLRFAGRVADSAASAIEKALSREESGKREESMRRLAFTDALTGLFNRRALDEKLQNEVERAQRYDTVLTCVMIDIDHFKRTNDSYGHQTGDRILAQFAELLRREQRTMDVLARYGGEEFVVLMPETGSAGARLFAERILRRVAQTTFGDLDAPVSLTASLGVATFPDARVSDAASLLHLADQNLLRAKADGRNRYRD